MITKDKLRKVILKHIIELGSMSALAKKLGVSLAYLSDVMADKREPGEKLLTALGYRRVVLYEPMDEEK